MGNKYDVFKTIQYGISKAIREHVPGAVCKNIMAARKRKTNEFQRITELGYTLRYNVRTMISLYRQDADGIRFSVRAKDGELHEVEFTTEFLFQYVDNAVIFPHMRDEVAVWDSEIEKFRTLLITFTDETRTADGVVKERRAGIRDKQGTSRPLWDIRTLIPTTWRTNENKILWVVTETAREKFFCDKTPATVAALLV